MFFFLSGFCAKFCDFGLSTVFCVVLFVFTQHIAPPPLAAPPAVAAPAAAEILLLSSQACLLLLARSLLRSLAGRFLPCFLEARWMLWLRWLLLM